MTTPHFKYNHVLAALDLDERAAPLLARAQALARAFDARLSVVHVVEYVPIESGDVLVATPVNLMQEISAQAGQKLQSLCAGAGLAADAASVRHGPVAAEILACARDVGADLVVVGHPPRRGLLSLFSHTDEDVVAKAPCDVLALRLP